MYTECTLDVFKSVERLIALSMAIRSARLLKDLLRFFEMLLLGEMLLGECGSTIDIGRLMA